MGVKKKTNRPTAELDMKYLPAYNFNMQCKFDYSDKTVLMSLRRDFSAQIITGGHHYASLWCKKLCVGSLCHSLYSSSFLKV